ncbi:hypothetical protein Q5N69_07720 [Pseudocolwellia sp. AS88]|uniref:hypothetical protein n=1 Tax=Pseudocolwellia sp. AS88 TaxID=3063958 RepID=UPI0026EDA246|nr:hypothetical protein [Pseudocolwellia sp. AS88]MDO7084759.1 hypothetical protein [Pseudocolwellia sp. AS88]
MDSVQTPVNIENNIQQQYKKVRFSSIPLNAECNNFYEYQIPLKYKPYYYQRGVRERVGFKIKTPIYKLPFEKVTPTSANELSVNLRAVKHERNMWTFNTLSGIQTKESYYTHIGKVGEFEKYTKGHITLYVLKEDKNNLPIIVEDFSSTFSNFRAYRLLNNYIEIDYIFSKKVTIEKLHILDKYILDLIGSFQISCSKTTAT